MEPRVVDKKWRNRKNHLRRRRAMLERTRYRDALESAVGELAQLVTNPDQTITIVATADLVRIGRAMAITLDVEAERCARLALERSAAKADAQSTGA